jgi:hypothetical protein
VLRIASIQDLLAVQRDHKVVSISRDFVLIPLIWLYVRGRRLDGSDEASRQETSGLIIPDLQLVTGDMRLSFFLRSEEYSAVYAASASKLNL